MKFLILEDDLFDDNCETFSNLSCLVILQPEKLSLAFASMAKI